MLLPTPDPVAFELFGLEIRWYGILIAIGMLLGLLIAYKRARSHEIDPERVIDLALVSIPVGIVGARLYYVVFNWDYYQDDFFRIIDFRGGGLAIHGGLLFGVVAAGICCKLWNIRPFAFLDLMAPSIALAQAIGRWGNYFNQEAHGGPTDLPWAIEVNGQMVHPTFLYESIWCFLLFLVLLWVGRDRRFDGQIFLLYGILYSIERFFVEQLRTDSLMVGPFRTAQLISIVVFLLFVLIYFYRNQRHGRKNRMFY